MASKEVVAITGASAGIGRAVAIEFAKRGAKIGLLARGEKALSSTKNDVIAAGGEAYTISVDVADAQAVDNAAQKIEDIYGPIDIWVNSAMTTVFSEFINITTEEFHRVTEVTYLGFVYGTHAALKRMLSRNRGTIIQVGSALAYRAIPLQSAYCGAKHAIRGFTDSIRSELQQNKSKVKISMVQLPAVNTPQFDWCKNNMSHRSQPVPPIYEPELIARHIYWVAHHHRRELLLGFNVWVIVWGNKFFPGLGDWYLGKTGYKSQQYNGAPDPNQKYNLWKPVDTDPGTRGSFSGRAVNTSLFMEFVHVQSKFIFTWIFVVISIFSMMTKLYRIRKIN
jgi:short-subunit dehydrogenase